MYDSYHNNKRINGILVTIIFVFCGEVYNSI